ncbi:hypothetical protein CCHL11_08972 [Colletotrichum chlorophyti]|uniref:Uncharacterized protein n=1 Tax=Colletotrichum chlorophyti TaxID=708187 RepID=A0A1Q8RS12_9PEZI|nr:hypothetical protein CCHL11_08972 [Colletotrichum chlorophyti]
MSSTPEHQLFLKYSDDPADDPAAESRSPLQRHVRLQNSLLSHISVFVITSLVWLFVFYFLVPTSTPTPVAQSRTSSGLPEGYTSDYRHNITTGRRHISCGNTTREAKARGCKYDILLNHWVPAACYDKESIEEYREDSSWGAFADMNMTQRLTVEEMSESDFYWTSIRDHINHCAIMWRRQFYALFGERRAIDTVITSPGHTEHCSQYLMDVMDARWREPTKTMRGFAGCWVRA